MRLGVVLVACCLSSCLGNGKLVVVQNRAAAPAPNVDRLRAGVAEVDITPPPGLPTYGFSSDGAARTEGYWLRLHGRIIVLANHNTGSAAGDLTQLLQDNQLAVIVGTTTRSNPTGPTGMTPLKLPRSGILISLPTEYRERAVPANGEILQPDYWVENSVTDVQTGRDAAFEKALELLRLQ